MSFGAMIAEALLDTYGEKGMAHLRSLESGGDNFARVTEAKKILFDLGLTGKLDEMDAKDRRFVMDMADRCDEILADDPSAIRVSPDQIFWLRDLVEKYL